MDHREDYFRLTDLVDFFGVIEESVLKPHHKKLFPLLMLEKSRRKIADEKKAKQDAESLLEHGVRQAASKMTVEEAYAELINGEPACEIEQMLKDYFIKNLPELLKRSVAAKPHTIEDNAGFDVVQLSNSPKQRVNAALAVKSNRMNRV